MGRRASAQIVYGFPVDDWQDYGQPPYRPWDEDNEEMESWFEECDAKEEAEIGWVHRWAKLNGINPKDIKWNRGMYDPGPAFDTTEWGPLYDCYGSWMVTVLGVGVGGDWDDPIKFKPQDLYLTEPFGRWDILKDAAEFFHLDWKKMKPLIGWYLLPSYG